MLSSSIIVMGVYIILIYNINNDFSHENKIPILAAIYTTNTLILMNLPEPLYYLITKIFKKIDLYRYEEEYTFSNAYFKLTGIVMAILSTFIYCIILYS